MFFSHHASKATLLLCNLHNEKYMYINFSTPENIPMKNMKNPLNHLQDKFCLVLPS